MKISEWLGFSPSTYFDRICQVLLIVVLGGVFQRFAWRDLADPYKCNGLLNEGTWLDPGPRNVKHKYENWQPPGCMMHKYTRKDIEECFENQRVVVAGDSTSRQIFEALLATMGTNLEAVAQNHHPRNIKHENNELHSGTTTLSFIWDPFLNSTALHKELETFRYKPSTDRNPDTALIFLRSPGLWHARHNIPDLFAERMEAIMPYTNPQYLRQLGGRWDPSNLILVSPVLVPYYRSLNPSRKATIKPAQITAMNDYLHEVSDREELPLVWSLTKMLEGDDNPVAHDGSGIHVIPSVAHVQTDILLNLRCNAKMASRGFPYNSRTCCMNYKGTGVIQLVLLYSSAVVLLLVVWKLVVSVFTSAPTFETSLKATSTILLILCLCFLADRTHVFEKTHKQYVLMEFGIACGVALLVGLATTKKIKIPSKQDRDDDLFLSRDQTDEWKGWMQVLILIYHYTGASKSLETYKIIRLLVSSYLFLTGYGNTLSLLQNENYSLKKTSAVVLRLNLLTIGLSYMMETNYLFYYFPALSTLWYLVIFLVLRIGYKRNNSFLFVICKIFCAGLLTTTFIKLPGILEAISWCLRLLFKIDWDVREWRFRLSLDLFIVYIGMIAGLVRRKSCETPDAEESQSWFNSHLQRFRHNTGKIGLILATVMGLGYPLISWNLTDKVSYNHILPYVSWAPILGFISLRNCHILVRSYYSGAFAWIGRISLETYILQYHIWLAGDTKGLLRMGLFNRWIEAAILTPLFVWLSWRTSDATRDIVRQMTDVKKIQHDPSVELEEGYALLKGDGNAEECDGGAEEGDEGSESPAEKAPDARNTSRACLSCRPITEFCKVLIGDLRWRLVMFTVFLWVANLVFSMKISTS